jgi:hypothetical protein
MKCADFRDGLIEWARNAELPAFERSHLAKHTNSCAECGWFLEEQRALTAASALLAEETSRIDAPREIEAALFAEFDTVHAWPGRVWPVRYGWRWVPIAAGAIAALMAIAWLAAPAGEKPRTVPVVRQIAPQPSGVPAAVLANPKPATARRMPVVAKRRRRAIPQAGPRVESADQPFVQVPYTLPLAPYERSSVMRVEMPVSALIAAGVPIATSNTGARVEADVVVGEDGRARAFRVISISSVDLERSIYR